MNEPNDYARVLRKDVEAIVAESSLRSQIISEARQGCTQGQPLDAIAFLAEHPEISTRKSIVLDLAYEEFCQRREAGESIDPDAYCRRFSEFDRSVRRMIAVHEFLDEHPQLIPTSDIDWPEPGQAFRGFSILAELGQGAFAKVYLAKETALGDRPVAIKVSRHGGVEAEILGKLRHPNIVPVFSVGEDAESGLTVVCMPYLGRDTLADVLDRLFSEGKRPAKARSILQALEAEGDESPAPDKDASRTAPQLCSGSFLDGAIHLGYQLADALAYAHSEKICHSDLKPSNVLITPSGKPMLLDFNLAFDPRSAVGRLGGTLPYMAPEQLRAIACLPLCQRPVVSERSDIFSLGVILYELFSGSLPFGPVPAGGPHDQISALLLERQESGPLSLRKLTPRVDRSLAGLLERCLAWDPEARPQSAAEVAAALRSSRSPTRRARRWLGQHRRLARSAAVLLLLGCLGTGYHLQTRDPYPLRQLIAGNEDFERGEYDQAEAHFSHALEAAESPEQRAEALFWRARSHQQAGGFPAALDDYRQAAKLSRAAEIRACQAYCSAWRREWEDAIFFSNKAIDAGFGTAAVYNNLGYCHLPKDQFGPALLALNEALRQDPRLQPALYSRACAELSSATKEGRRVSGQARRDIDEAIAAGSPSAELYLTAARIYFRLEERPDQYRVRIVRDLLQALRLGADPNVIRQEFGSLVDDPAFDGLLEGVAPGPEPTQAVRLVDPLAGYSFGDCASFLRPGRPSP